MVWSVIPKAPYSAFKGERLPGIGHNQGPPLQAEVSWRRYAWKKARQSLMPRLPLEVVRRRVKRARDLGLEYPVYASILLGTGRDILGFLFTCKSLGDHVAREGRLPGGVVRKIETLHDVHTMLAVESGINALEVVDSVRRNNAVVFSSSTSLPPYDQHWHQGRDAILRALTPMSLPSDAVVMIGAHKTEREWADAARLARFLPADRYFPTV